MSPKATKSTDALPVLPPGVRGWVWAAFFGLAAVGAALFIWRGPAILLDLAALSGGWICF